MSVEVFTLVYHEVPKSVNAGGGGSRRHWAVGAREKKRWEEIFRGLLLEQNVPKGMDHCHADLKVFWRRRARRDSTNYIAPILKPLADVLAPPSYLYHGRGNARVVVSNPAPRWLADDTDEFFEFGRLIFEYPPSWPVTDPRVKAILQIRLEARYGEAPHPGQLGALDAA